MMGQERKVHEPRKAQRLESKRSKQRNKNIGPKTKKKSMNRVQKTNFKGHLDQKPIYTKKRPPVYNH